MAEEDDGAVRSREAPTKIGLIWSKEAELLGGPEPRKAPTAHARTESAPAAAVRSKSSAALCSSRSERGDALLIVQVPPIAASRATRQWHGNHRRDDRREHKVGPMAPGASRPFGRGRLGRGLVGDGSPAAGEQQGRHEARRAREPGHSDRGRAAETGLSRPSSATPRRTPGRNRTAARLQILPQKSVPHSTRGSPAARRQTLTQRKRGTSRKARGSHAPTRRCSDRPRARPRGARRRPVPPKHPPSATRLVIKHPPAHPARVPARRSGGGRAGWRISGRSEAGGASICQAASSRIPRPGDPKRAFSRALAHNRWAPSRPPRARSAVSHKWAPASRAPRGRLPTARRAARSVDQGGRGEEGGVRGRRARDRVQRVQRGARSARRPASRRDPPGSPPPDAEATVSRAALAGGQDVRHRAGDRGAKQLLKGEKVRARARARAQSRARAFVLSPTSNGTRANRRITSRMSPRC